MSLLFESLQRVEYERAEFYSPPPPEAAELLRCVERRVASKLETAPKRPENKRRLSDQTEPSRPPAPALTSPATAGPARAGSAQKSPLDLPTGVRRAAATLRFVLPFIERMLPLLDGNIGVGTAISNLLTPPPASPLPPPVDLAPIEDGLAKLKTQHRELRDQVVEQNNSLKRVEDRLETVREATDRNTLEQQELIEDLKGGQENQLPGIDRARPGTRLCRHHLRSLSPLP